MSVSLLKIPMHNCNKKEAATKTFENHTLINRNVYMPYHRIYTKAHSLKHNQNTYTASYYYDVKTDYSIYNA